jgi:hypothetical protein
MYEQTKKTAKGIVDSINDVAKARTTKGKDYLKAGKSMISSEIPAEADAGKKIEKFIEQNTSAIKSKSKKIKVEIE